MLYVGISFDYDSPAGYRESFNIKSMAPDSDQKGTDALLKVLASHQVQATFAIVANAALEGVPPEFCPDQIREIYSLGHEIASHSMTHRYLPSMNREEMLEEFKKSKNVLEACIGASVRGFIPPFNRPMHFPSRGAFSLEEALGLSHRGRGRQSIETMLKGLNQSGYGWARVSFQSKVNQLLIKLKFKRLGEILPPFIFEDIVAIPLHSTGFSHDSIKMVRDSKKNEELKFLTIYGHPNQALTENEQSAKELDRFLGSFQKERLEGTVKFGTMEGIEKILRTQVRSV